MIGRTQYQREVERLLAEIDHDTHRLWVAKFAGARGRALSERKQELEHARMRLALLTNGVDLHEAQAA